MRSSDIKYLGFGFGIGALLAGFFLVVFFIPQSNAQGAISLFGVRNTALPTITSTSQPTSTATTTPSSTATFTPTATSSLTPSPTITATLTTTELMVANGAITFSGPLTIVQQIKLYEASLSFIAPTYEEAKRMSVLINYARFSDPNTTCGPLSIAILQKAGILNEELVAHDFFLLYPSLGKDREMVNNVFSPNRYSDTRYKARIDQTDWQTNPLMPGDFVYIYKGTGGNFEHMLVVNRVDAQGRAYAVTNYGTDQGFVINERMLYDPNDPNAGLFSTWTEKQFAKLGSTGFAGYEVWRLIK